jgi:hypothetical protein
MKDDGCKCDLHVPEQAYGVLQKNVRRLDIVHSMEKSAF